MTDMQIPRPFDPGNLLYHEPLPVRMLHDEVRQKDTDINVREIKMCLNFALVQELSSKMCRSDVIQCLENAVLFVMDN